jgi:hypothetical protein
MLSEDGKQLRPPFSETIPRANGLETNLLSMAARCQAKKNRFVFFRTRSSGFALSHSFRVSPCYRSPSTNARNRTNGGRSSSRTMGGNPHLSHSPHLHRPSPRPSPPSPEAGCLATSPYVVYVLQKCWPRPATRCSTTTKTWIFAGRLLVVIRAVIDMRCPDGTGRARGRIGGRGRAGLGEIEAGK